MVADEETSPHLQVRTPKPGLPEELSGPGEPLIVDAVDPGEGLLSLGTEVKWNDQAGKIEITNVTSQPIKLGDVRPVEK